MIPVFFQRHAVAAQKGKEGKDKKSKGAPEKGKEKKRGYDSLATPYFYLVAGGGFEPPTFGL